MFLPAQLKYSNKRRIVFIRLRGTACVNTAVTVWIYNCAEINLLNFNAWVKVMLHYTFDQQDLTCHVTGMGLIRIGYDSKS